MKQFNRLLAAILLLTVLATVSFAEEVRHAELNVPTHPRVENINSEGIADPLPPRYENGGIMPLALALVPPVQFPPEDWDVYGVRVGLVSRQNNVRYVDVGIIANFALGDVEGLEIGVAWNQVDHDLNAIQFAAIGNYVRGNATGLQIAGLLNNNSPVGSTKGCQIACVNLAGNLEGLQIGVFNRAEDVYGLQIGAINYTENINGLQLGVINVIHDSTVPVMIGLNFAF